MSYSDILRRVIVDQIGHFLVLPNKLCLSLSNEVAPEILKIPEPAVSLPFFCLCLCLVFFCPATRARSNAAVLNVFPTVKGTVT